jgi:hypothetical protein
VWTQDGFPVMGTVTGSTPDVPLSEVYAIWQNVPAYTA